MSEQRVGTGDQYSPEIAITPEDVASTDQTIGTILTYYENRLPPDPEIRQKYHAQFVDDEDDKHKIDFVCWQWGEVAEWRDDAANLRGLVLLRALQRTILSGTAAHTYVLPVGWDAEFWGLVDKHLYDGIDLIRRQHGATPMMPVNEVSDEMHTMGFYNGALLYRQLNRSTKSEGDTIIYGIVHQDLP